MTISAKIILDSKTLEGVRVTTFELGYPRLIHSEVMTHRLFSRNASSSRAIPVERLIQGVLDDTAMPVKWGRNQPGMQAGEDWNAPIFLSSWHPTEQHYFTSPEGAWLHARDHAVRVARAFADSEYHKQVVNRLLEPFAHIRVVVTSTDFNNWFSLRYHEDADPTICALAKAMYEEYVQSEPYELSFNNWHLPYVTHKDKLKVRNYVTGDYEFENPFYDEYLHLLIKISVARCARVSYKTHDGKDTEVEDDIKLYDRLLNSVPLHASPAEHQCTADYRDLKTNEWFRGDLHGNLTGAIQYRKLLNGEMQHEFIRYD